MIAQYSPTQPRTSHGHGLGSAKPSSAKRVQPKQAPAVDRQIANLHTGRIPSDGWALAGLTDHCKWVVPIWRRDRVESEGRPVQVDTFERPEDGPTQWPVGITPIDISYA
jgi:hypothetical protein